MSTQDVSDSFLQALAAMAARVNIPGHFILEVWNSETGVQATTSHFGGTTYFGPAAVMSNSVSADLTNMNLDQRLPYMESLLKYQSHMNHGVAPDRPEVLYGINFLPAPMYAAGPNAPESTLLVARNGQFWADNPAFHADADLAGITVGTLGKVLARKRATDPRIQDLLARYTALTGIPYPSGGLGGAALAGGVGLGVLFLGVAAGAYAWMRGWV